MSIFPPLSKNSPRENVVIVRGKNDRWFCDEAAARILKEEKIRCVEVDAGHDWNENIAYAIRDILTTLDDRVMNGADG